VSYIPSLPRSGSKTEDVSIEEFDVRYNLSKRVRMGSISMHTLYKVRKPPNDKTTLTSYGLFPAFTIWRTGLDPKLIV
jgi:hypothetical protein